MHFQTGWKAGWMMGIGRQAAAGLFAALALAAAPCRAQANDGPAAFLPVGEAVGLEADAYAAFFTAKLGPEGDAIQIRITFPFPDAVRVQAAVNATPESNGKSLSLAATSRRLWAANRFR